MLSMDYSSSEQVEQQSRTGSCVSRSSWQEQRKTTQAAEVLYRYCTGSVQLRNVAASVMNGILFGVVMIRMMTSATRIWLCLSNFLKIVLAVVAISLFRLFETKLVMLRHSSRQPDND